MKDDETRTTDAPVSAETLERGLLQDAATAFVVGGGTAAGVDAYHTIKDKIAGQKDQGLKIELPGGVDPD